MVAVTPSRHGASVMMGWIVGEVMLIHGIGFTPLWPFYGPSTQVLRRGHGVALNRCCAEVLVERHRKDAKSRLSRPLTTGAGRR
jgi:hypothetical protein